MADQIMVNDTHTSRRITVALYRVKNVVRQECQRGAVSCSSKCWLQRNEICDICVIMYNLKK